MPAKAYTVEPTGDITFVQAFLSGAIVNISVAPTVAVAPDERIFLAFDQERIHLFDGATGDGIEGRLRALAAPQSKKPASSSRRYFLGRLGIDVEAEARPVEQVDHAVDHHALRQPLDDLVPPGIGGARIFEGDIIRRQSGADIDERAEPEQAVGGAVRRHQDRMHMGVLGDPFQLGDATDIGRIGADDIDRLRLDQLLEIIAEIDLLAGMDRRRG